MAVSLNDIITEARQATNTLNSGFFDDTVELPGYVNDELSDLYDRVVGSYEKYFIVSKNFTLTSSNSIELATLTGADPSEQFYKEVGLDWWPSGVAGTAPAITVYPIGTYEDRNYGNVGVSVGMFGPARQYDLVGSQLQILPNTVPFAGVYTLRYIPNAPTLTNDVNLPVELERWKKLLILKVTKRMKDKREQDVTSISTEIATQEKRIDDAARHRKKEGKRIPNRVRSGYPGGYGGPNGWWL